MSRSYKRGNLRALLRFVLILVGLVVTYSALFQAVMVYEGHSHSWVTGLYWTLSTMSTLGYGDIVFGSDLGRAFAIVVLLSGIIFLLVLLPTTFMKLVYEPWVEARAVSRVARAVPVDMNGHVIVTFYGPVVSALIAKLAQFNYPYVVILPEQAEVMRLGDEGIHAIWGDLDDPQTYIRARVEHAAMVATTRPDVVNTSVVFTVRGITDTTPVIATAREDVSVEVLKLAGCNRVLDLTMLIAEALAQRAIGGPQVTHVVGRIDDLLIAEVDAARTALVGKPFNEAQRLTSVSIVGFWVRGTFEAGQAESSIESNAVLVVAGSSQQLREFETSCQAMAEPEQSVPVIIIGGGRVGRATDRALKRRGIDCRIIEMQPDRIRDADKYVLGSAADKSVLQKAGIEQAPTIIITPRDDETNIYLTILCRLLRPDIQIICRATLERSVAALHRAGSDIVMSYASMGANALFNLLQRSDVLMIAEGLDVFKVPVPGDLAGKTIAEADIRRRTSCTVIGIDSDDRTVTNPGPDTLLPADGEIVLIGTPEGEMEFLKTFSHH